MNDDKLGPLHWDDWGRPEYFATDYEWREDEPDDEPEEDEEEE